MFVLLGLFVHAVHSGTCAFHVENCQHADKKTAHATIGLRYRHRSNPRPARFVSGKAGKCRCRPRRYQLDPWSRGREVARGVLRSSPKHEKRPIFCRRRGIENFCRLFLHSSAQMCLYQTPGRRPPPITGRFVNTLTRGWVGAPNELAPFRFHGAVVGFVDRCLSRTRNLAASNKHLAEFFSAQSWPKIGSGIVFFGVFQKFEAFFFEDLCS